MHDIPRPGTDDHHDAGGKDHGLGEVSLLAFVLSGRGGALEGSRYGRTAIASISTLWAVDVADTERKGRLMLTTMVDSDVVAE